MNKRSPFANARRQRGAMAAGQAPLAACASRSPRQLTGGESPVIVDWLTVTWKPEPDEVLVFNVQDLLCRVMGDVFGIEVPGLYGYETGVKLTKMCNDSLISVGRLDYGGDHHAGRARLDLSGTGCGQVNNWHFLQSEVSEFSEVKLTRVDLAYDSIDGAFTVEDAKEWLLQGEFNCGGRNPRHSTPGDWQNPNYAAGEGLRYGRTLEIGRRENGKMLRSYEKGRQLGESDSPWTRFEVEIRNIDRDIPLEILTEREKYFVGAYECLQRLVDSDSQKISTHQKEGEISMERLTHYARVSYGKLIQVMRGNLSANEIIEELARPGLPRRLEKPVLTGFSPQAAPPGISLTLN